MCLPTWLIYHPILQMFHSPVCVNLLFFALWSGNPDLWYVLSHTQAHTHTHTHTHIQHTFVQRWLKNNKDRFCQSFLVSFTKQEENFFQPNPANLASRGWHSYSAKKGRSHKKCPGMNLRAGEFLAEREVITFQDRSNYQTMQLGSDVVSAFCPRWPTQLVYMSWQVVDSSRKKSFTKTLVCLGYFGLFVLFCLFFFPLLFCFCLCVFTFSSLSCSCLSRTNQWTSNSHSISTWKIFRVKSWKNK